MSVSPLLGLLAVLLFFVWPGFGLSVGLFPERLRPRADRGRIALELATLSVIVSLSVTILFGELLQAGPGFSASWTDPRLEGLDALAGALGLGVGIARGALHPTETAVPSAPAPEGPREGWETLRTLERLDQERRTIDRRLRQGDLGAAERADLEARRARVDGERQAVRRLREAENAS